MQACFITANNVIDWVSNTTVSTTAPYVATNIANVNTYGVDFYLTISPEKINKNAFIKLVKLDFTYMQQDHNVDKQYVSKYAQTYLKNKFGLMVNHKIYKKIQASWYWVYKERYGTFNMYKTGDISSYKPYNLLNGRIYFEEKHYNIFIEANNILDVEYYDSGSLPQPGRWFGGGIKINY
jgi:iron complex outermembrane receptor protein